MSIRAEREAATAADRAVMDRYAAAALEVGLGDVWEFIGGDSTADRLACGLIGALATYLLETGYTVEQVAA